MTIHHGRDKRGRSRGWPDNGRGRACRGPRAQVVLQREGLCTNSVVDAGAVDILPALLETFCHILVISHALKNGLANLYFPPNW